MTKYKFLGGGFIQGIPARDLTEDEFNALTDGQKEQVRKSGLYELNKVSSKKPAEKEE